MPTVDEITNEGVAKLQAIVDAGEALSADLRTQRGVIQAQIATLQKQIADINTQITAAEGPETAAARKAINDVTLLRNAGPGPRRFIR